ncbi:MAG: hypothetical protein K6U87_09265 [Firmicutes bacterium]|nr:hypothetical protein [Bacillota bacterium]
MLLDTVATQDVQRELDDTAQMAEQVAPDRVISVVDPQMRHGRKTSRQRFAGYKAHVTAHVGGGDPAHWITVMPGNTPDGEGVVPLLGEREALTRTLPATPLGHTASGGARTRADVAEVAPTVRVETPVPPGSARAGPWPKTAFPFDRHQGTVTHLAGVTERPAGLAYQHPHRARPVSSWRGVCEERGGVEWY